MKKYNAELSKKIDELSKKYNTIELINKKSIDLVEKLSDLDNYEEKYYINIELDALKIIKDNMLIEKNFENSRNNTNKPNTRRKLIYPKVRRCYV